MQKLLIIAGLLVLASCQKDPIEIQEDLCKGVICQNGGYCINGDCECPPEWTGPSCAQEVPPIKMRVGTIALTSFPATDSQGAGWDLLSGPDVYLSISIGNTVLFETSYFQNLTGLVYWDVNFEFPNPTATYTISVLDYDDGLTDDDLMGYINFTPYRPGQKFPASYPLQCSGCPVSFQLSGIKYFH